MPNDTNSGGTVMLAFVVGALTGAAVALLFAPASGEETREYIGQKTREGRARARGTSLTLRVAAGSPAARVLELTGLRSTLPVVVS